MAFITSKNRLNEMEGLASSAREASMPLMCSISSTPSTQLRVSCESCRASLVWRLRQAEPCPANTTPEPRGVARSRAGSSGRSARRRPQRREGGK